VIVYGAQPPPLQGMSVINAAIAQRLGQSGSRVVIADTSPGDTRGARYYLRRALGVLSALIKTVIHATTSRRSCYASVDSGWGILYTIAIAASARLFGYRIALHYHSSDYVNRYRPLCALLVRLAGPRAAHVLASEAMIERFTAKYRGARILLPVHNAAFVQLGVPRVATESRPITLGLLSNLTRDKGLDAALETATALLRRGLGCRLILAGPLIDPAAQQAVAAASKVLGSRLELRGVVSGPSKQAFFGDIDVFLFATSYSHETQSLVVPEAMAHSIPVIAYAHGFVAELLRDGGGILVNPDSDFVTRATSVLEQWEKSPDTRLQHGLRARESFIRHQRLAVDQMTTVLNELTWRSADERMSPGGGTSERAVSL
jgi:glycosyltransferase involved in cell wall biosynthesis